MSPEEQAEIDKALEEVQGDPMVQLGQAVWQSREALPDALKDQLEETAGLVSGEEQAQEDDPSQDQSRQLNQDQQLS